MAVQKGCVDRESESLTEWERRQLAHFERCSPWELGSFGEQTLAQYRSLMLKYLAESVEHRCRPRPLREAARLTCLA